MTPFSPSITAGVLLLTLALASMAPSVRADDTARKQAVTRPTQQFAHAEPYEVMSAGAATSRKRVNRDAFSQSSANMSFERELQFKVGNGLFRREWVSAPASTTATDGLGPLFNARSCQGCHLKDGRGHPPARHQPADSAVSLLIRLSIPPQTAAQRGLLTDGRINSVPEPVYGGQFQDLAIQGLAAEGKVHITYAEQPVPLADGTVVQLRQPTYRLVALTHGPMHPRVMLSPRIAPPMIGLGLLEAVAEADVLAHADPDDTDGDGISGRANRVWSPVEGRMMLGRFGWKAGVATVLEQSAGAFSGDIGMSTSQHPQPAGDCTAAQRDCLDAPQGATPEEQGVEISDTMLDLVAFYSRNLAVPRRRDIDHPAVLAGKRIFYQSGCAACHVPKFVTRRDTAPEQSWQLIWPYTDMLLHDMGEGLADQRPEALANGREWRTPPLWGIGLTQTVSGHTQFLHDGRARNLLEAILWHGGEATASRERIRRLSAEDRQHLLAFLNSL